MKDSSLKQLQDSEALGLTTKHFIRSIPTVVDPVTDHSLWAGLHTTTIPTLEFHPSAK